MQVLWNVHDLYILQKFEEHGNKEVARSAVNSGVRALLSIAKWTLTLVHIHLEA